HVVWGCIRMTVKPKRSAGPLNWQLRQSLCNPGVAPGIAEQDEIVFAGVVFRHIVVVLDGQRTTEITMPFVGKAFQACVGPGPDIWVPRLAGAAHAQKRSRKCIVDRPLNAGTF